MNRWVLCVSLVLHGLLLGVIVRSDRPAVAEKQAPEALTASLLAQRPEPLTAAPASRAQPSLPKSAPPPPVKQSASTQQTEPRIATPPPAAPAAPASASTPTQASASASTPTQASASEAAATVSTVSANPSQQTAHTTAPTAQTAAAAVAGPGPKQGVSIDASYAATNPVPPYPAVARRLGEQGTVVLRVLVGVDGTAREIQLKKSSGSPSLDRSAETTIKQWRFNPARIDGKPVEEWYETRWTFRLEG